MTQLALCKTTGAALVFLLAKMFNESLPTALKVGVSHQGEPQVPVYDNSRVCADSAGNTKARAHPTGVDFLTTARDGAERSVAGEDLRVGIRTSTLVQ